MLPQEGSDTDNTVINHCRWDKLRNILPSLVFKPSFRRYVLANFEANNTAAIPILYRLADLSWTSRAHRRNGGDRNSRVVQFSASQPGSAADSVDSPTSVRSSHAKSSDHPLLDASDRRGHRIVGRRLQLIQ
ncbi:hypothetical protein ORI20_11665 [Mycobacterium sp. CVI_P3]|uniref:Uncharacterized protein n=1 Tax=Mycobacterium pinniadriaticum TaxID=2994102 RepID=A0ABT3SE05_9MYCO|nr:hypothetical protein [Mycobacterium pinniadriaticum]MCX2930939.1 hypothetical protein [Mycobacterium pinniadriaticum]MCX2937363.1 hypothetical protein [Mycobacterium pinniadriaticum]